MLSAIKLIVVIVIFILTLSLTIYFLRRLCKKAEVITFGRKVIYGRSAINIYKAITIFVIILIAFFVILLGTTIYKNIYGFADKNMDYSKNQLTSIYNMQFEDYFGTEIKGSKVKNLISKIQTNNRLVCSNDKEIGNVIYIQVDGKDIKDYNSISEKKKYEVSLNGNNKASDQMCFGTDYWKNGCIKSIKIETIK